MSHAFVHPEKAIPAQLRFLAIYNPSLGRNDDTRHDQIVYYFANETSKSSAKHAQETSKVEGNERLRQIGLAQGMVEFGKVFSQGKAVDAIETDKSRIVLQELEEGWWILASVDLTRLPKASKPSDSKYVAREGANVEYSSREVKPSVLLVQDLLQAHSIFLLHHASSMSALFARNRRSTFTYLLRHYWDKFLSTWNVMLYGNPATNVYGGIKIAGSGELGMGVGEEDRGSGEREVLEGFVGRIDGLVDLVVSRFGDISTDTERSNIANQYQPRSHLAPSELWLGTGSEPGVNDGAIFLGVGALSRMSLRDITHWMEDIYSWGSRAYGVHNNPVKSRRPRQKDRMPTNDSGSTKSYSTQAEDANRPSHAIYTSQATPDSAPEAGNSTKKQTISPVFDKLNTDTDIEVLDPRPVDETNSRENERNPSSQRAHSRSSSHSGKAGTFVDYLKLGYGTHWSLGGGATKPQDTGIPSDTASVSITPDNKGVPENADIKTSKNKNPGVGLERLFYPDDDSRGHYLVGLVGDVEAEDPENSGSESIRVDTEIPSILFRTVTVELSQETEALSDANSGVDSSTTDKETQMGKYDSLPQPNTSTSPQFESRRRDRKELRVVVYAIKPFLFTLLFDLSTNSLSEASIYRSLHYQLAPLQRPLSTSTRQKLPRPNLGTTLSKDAKTPIYDLMWDPKQLTIWSTIPDIPSTPSPSTKPPVWTRFEALNTHMQILSTFAATRNKSYELEQTCKTSRGYWVVWTRIPDPEVAKNKKSMSGGTVTPVESNATIEAGSSPRNMQVVVQASDIDQSVPQVSYTSNKTDAVKEKEIFLVRKSSDPTTASAFARENANTPAKLAQGIGVDTKRYIDGLLDMYR